MTDDGARLGGRPGGSDSPSGPLGPAGWIRGIRLMMNGRTVTMAELHAAWPDPDDCAPGLGYVCPSHRAGRVDDAPWSTIERGPMIRRVGELGYTIWQRQ